MWQLIHECEDLQSLHPGTYGSQANRQASMPTFIEVLQYNYIQHHCIQDVTKNRQILPKIIIFSVKIGQILIGIQRQATPYH
jgi:hypothetical protein